ncbi:helix-turn-helix domain-containing protein [Streptomyces sp. PGLac3x]
MPKRKSESGAAVTARTVLQENLERLRAQADLSFEELNDKTGWDRAYLHRLHTGASIGTPEVMEALDGVYGSGTQLQHLWTLARDDAFGARYKVFMDKERVATVQYKYSCSVVPGLFQTADYAHALMSRYPTRSEEELREEISKRLSRQEILAGPNPPHVRVILDETVFRRTPPEPIWRDQLAALIEAAQRPNVTIQVVPFAAGLHPLEGGSLTVLWLSNGKAVAYLESSDSGELVEEPGRVEQLRLSYDLLRDDALSPEASLTFMESLSKESTGCDPDPI